METRKPAAQVFSMLPWIICGMGALFYCYEYFLRIAPNVMMSHLMQSYHINGFHIGNLVGFYYYAYTPAQLLVGILMDKYGPRKLLTLACFICVVGSYLFAVTSDIHVAEIGRFLVGFGSAFAFVGVLKLATVWFPARHFALITGLASALGTIGALSGDILLSKMVNVTGWRNTLMLSPIMGLVLVLFLWIFIRDTNPKGEGVTHKEIPVVGSLLSVFKNPQLWLVGLVGCLLYLPTSSFAEAWGIPYFKTAYHYSTQKATLCNSMIFLGFTLAAPIAGFVSDLLQLRRLPMILGGIGASVVISTVLYVPDLPDFTVFSLMFLFGMLYGVQAIVFVVGRELNPEALSGTAMAATNMLVMLGGVIFQPAIGALLDFSWSGLKIQGAPVFTALDYQFALAILPIGLFLGAVAAYKLKETGRPSQAA